MDIRKEIKILLLENDLNLTELAKKIAEAKGCHYSVQNLSNKLKKGSITFNELQLIADILNYEIKLEKRTVL
jgi:hypothetical protein